MVKTLLETVPLGYSNHLAMSDLFHWMPISTLIIDRKGTILDINQQALNFFGAESHDTFLEKNNFNSLVIDLSRSMELVVEISSINEVLTKKILLRRLDNSILCVDIYARTFPETPNLILFQFTETSPKIHALLTQMIQAFRVEIQRLKPYLNKPGKELLEQIIIDNALEDKVKDLSSGKNLFDIVSQERITQLINLFPELTNSELTICAFLSIKMTIDEIASLTSKTSNCLRVSFHRILRKTNMNSGKEFLRKLEALS